MIPSWQRFGFQGDLLNGWEEDGEPEKVLTKEQKAILKDKFLYDSWRYK